MITLRRAKERHHDCRRKQEVWLTFYSEDRADPLADGFGALEILNEDRVPPGAGVPRHRQHDAEIVTYVRKGALAYEDSMSRAWPRPSTCSSELRRTRHDRYPAGSPQAL